MDPAAIAEISKAGTDILAPPAVVATVTTAKPIANGETKTWDGWTIEAIPAYNLKRGPAPGKFFHDKGRGNGYVLTYGCLLYTSHHHARSERFPACRQRGYGARARV